jgi:hypothetical protein
VGIASQFCHLNLLVEKLRKNEGLGLFSAEGNKRGITFYSSVIQTKQYKAIQQQNKLPSQLDAKTRSGTNAVEIGHIAPTTKTPVRHQSPTRKLYLVI